MKNNPTLHLILSYSKYAILKYKSYLLYRVVKKCFKNIIKTTYHIDFFRIKIADKLLSLSKFCKHLVYVKIVKIRYLNGHQLYEAILEKQFFVKIFTKISTP